MTSERLLAPKYKRLLASLIDYLIVFMLWYFMTSGDLNKVDQLMETLDPVAAGALDQFIEAVLGMVTAFVLKWLFAQTLYFCLIPAILGNGKTIGKLILRISLLDAHTLEEMSPSRLMLREAVGRTLLETLLVLPGIVSVIMLLFSKDGISLRDRIANTVVAKDTSYLE